VIARQLKSYYAYTSPLVDYYRSQGELVDIDAMASPMAVTERLMAMLEQFANKR
jgi:adenylate kinase family enzyme